jgi:hypothetical protein
VIEVTCPAEPFDDTMAARCMPAARPALYVMSVTEWSDLSV